MTITVTGATGRLGNRVARRLAAAGIPHNLCVRDPHRAPHLPGTTITHTDYGNPHTARHALTGTRHLLMVAATEHPHRLHHHRTFIDAALHTGVEHLTYISFQNASPHATFTLAREHWATEQHLRDSGITHTILRCNLYADLLTGLIGPDDTIRGPAADGHLAPVTIDDVADTATAVLTHPTPHRNTTHTLTGPTAHTLHDIATTLSEALGYPVTYQPQTITDAYTSRTGQAPPWQIDAWVSTYTAIAHGELATVTDAVPTLTGHPATSLRTLLRL